MDRHGHSLAALWRRRAQSWTPLRCARWHCDGAAEPQRLALVRYLEESWVQVCVLQEPHFNSMDGESVGLGGHHHSDAAGIGDHCGRIPVLLQRDLGTEEQRGSVDTGGEVVSVSIHCDSPSRPVGLACGSI
ncbi:hypothetical protein ABB37_05956 [Leptomonas pyrrhocoris]|uniref:Uncharacterized protein n=1 Tax=Leptomonas pyrrhocoris TaxID=157538 RepID=A0A0N0DUG3_LEPPY|nr:hypothetical protein ABB37_05956 [Leptomonas pyrrhocoris]KPA78892.1 hypothetical protein ABB37_05956 [Leptomonas pyrrhocoris]|eukprot:XP_015657331.1 hypothetical protein ABB37_05956 [Leptomonas pyrrhocoris]